MKKLLLLFALLFFIIPKPAHAEENVNFLDWTHDEQMYQLVEWITEITGHLTELEKENEELLERIEDLEEENERILELLEVTETSVDEVEETEEVVEEDEESVIDTAGFKHEVIDGVDSYTIYKGISWSANTMMNSFSLDAVNLLRDVHEELENGVVFRLATDMVDGYGNEGTYIVANAWFSQDTVERINFDNWPLRASTGLYDTADGVRIYFGLVSDIDQDQKPTDYAPQFYYDSIYMEYEED